MTEEQMLNGALQFRPELAAAWLAPAFVAVIAILASHDHAPYKRRRVENAGRLLIFAYIVAIGLTMLWPLELRVSADALREGNWLPFRGALGFLLSNDPIRVYLGQLDIVAHVLLFAPLGLLLPFAFARPGLIIVLVTIAVWAFGFEMLQGLTVPDRIFDIDQVIAAITGGMAAAIASNALELAAHLGRLATR